MNKKFSSFPFVSKTGSQKIGNFKFQVDIKCTEFFHSQLKKSNKGENFWVSDYLKF